MTRPPRGSLGWGVMFPDTGRIYPCSEDVPWAQRRQVAATFAAAAGLILMYHDGRRWLECNLDHANVLGWP